MSTEAQIAPNRANSQSSCGPKTAHRKASSAKNSFRYGLAGPFVLLGWEHPEEFNSLESDLVAEHKPATATERMLVREMAQSHWLRQRAIILQNACLNSSSPAPTSRKSSRCICAIRPPTVAPSTKL